VNSLIFYSSGQPRSSDTQAELISEEKSPAKWASWVTRKNLMKMFLSMLFAYVMLMFSMFFMFTEVAYAYSSAFLPLMLPMLSMLIVLLRGGSRMMHRQRPFRRGNYCPRDDSVRKIDGNRSDSQFARLLLVHGSLRVLAARAIGGRRCGDTRGLPYLKGTRRVMSARSRRCRVNTENELDDVEPSQPLDRNLNTLPGLWGGVKGGKFDADEQKLLKGLSDLLKSFSPKPKADDGGGAQPRPPDPGGSVKKQRKANRDDSLIGGLRRLLERMEQPGRQVDSLQSLQNFVASYAKRSGGEHREQQREQQQREQRTGRAQAKATSQQTFYVGNGRRSPKGTGAGAAKPAVAATDSGRRSFKDVAERAIREPPDVQPVMLNSLHWTGTHVELSEFVEKVSCATSGSHIIAGVTDKPPPGFDGLLVPDDITATLVLRPGSYEGLNGLGVETSEIQAPAACKRGHFRVQKLAYAQLGKSQFPLKWMPKAVSAAPVVEETVTIRGQLFGKFYSAAEWAKVRALAARAQHEHIRKIVLKTPKIEADDVIDVFDFRRPDDSTDRFISCTIRIKKSALGHFMAASGSTPLLYKDFTNSLSVQWVKPQDGESGEAHLTRAYQLSLESNCQGLAFSSTGSLGMRVPKGESQICYRVSGLKCGTARSQVQKFLADRGWREVAVISTTARKDKLVAIIRAMPPSGEVIPPWSYELPNGSNVDVEIWMPAKDSRPLAKDGTSAMRVPTADAAAAAAGGSVITQTTRAAMPAEKAAGDNQADNRETVGDKAKADDANEQSASKQRKAVDTIAETLGLTVVANDGNGDCLPLSVAQAFEASGKTIDAKTIRAQTCATLLKEERSFAKIFGSVDPNGKNCTWKGYVNAVKKPGTMMGSRELLAMAMTWGVRFVIVRPGLETVRVGAGESIIWLKLHGQHYEFLKQTRTPEFQAARKEHIKSIASAYHYVFSSEVDPPSFLVDLTGSGKAKSVASMSIASSVRGKPSSMSVASSVAARRASSKSVPPPAARLGSLSVKVVNDLHEHFVERALLPSSPSGKKAPAPQDQPTALMPLASSARGKRDVNKRAVAASASSAAVAAPVSAAVASRLAMRATRDERKAACASAKRSKLQPSVVKRKRLSASQKVLAQLCKDIPFKGSMDEKLSLVACRADAPAFAQRLRQTAERLHPWLHRPARASDDAAAMWKCAACELTGNDLQRFVSNTELRTPCPKCPTAKLVDLDERRRVAIELGFASLNFGSAPQPACSDALSTYTPRKSAAVGYICPVPGCGWSLPADAKQPTRHVSQHIRMHGKEPPSYTPGHDSEGAKAMRKAQVASADRLLEAWKAEAPSFAHRIDKVESRRSPGEKVSNCRRFLHCTACNKWMEAALNRTLPCYAAAGFDHAQQPAFAKNRAKYITELRITWKRLRREHTIANRKNALGVHQRRLRNPSVPLC